MSSCDKSQMRKKKTKRTTATAKMTVMMAEATTATRSEYRHSLTSVLFGHQFD